MHMDKKDELIIDALLKLEKRLYDVICNLVLGYDYSVIFEKYKSLLLEEEKLISKLEVDEEKYKEYMKYLVLEDMDRTSSLLTTVSLYIDGVHYVRIRLVTRLYNALISRQKLKYDYSIAPLFIDEQVAILYNVLKNKSEEEANLAIAPKLRIMSIFTLADSPNVEKEFLSVPYGEDLAVYDTIRVATDLIVHKKEEEQRKPYPELPVVYAHSKEPYVASYETIISLYFKKTLNMTANSIKEIVLSDKKYYTNFEFVYLLSYLESVIAIFPEQERSIKYQLLSDRYIGSSKNRDEYISRLNDMINEIEGTIVPSIIRARINPLLTPPNYHK